MRRRLHLIFAAATVLLLAAWLLSGRWMVSATVGTHSRATVIVFRGQVVVWILETDEPSGNPWLTYSFDDALRGTGVKYRLYWLPGWHWGSQGTVTGVTLRLTMLKIPLWMPAALTGALTPLLWRRHRRRLRRQRAGRCPFCGYDLAGMRLTDAGKLRCPECGKAAGSAKRTVKSAK